MSDAERIEQLISALRDENEALRDHAAASLGQMGADALPQLIGLMADEDVVIREAAASAVVRIGPVAIDQLLEALADDEWAIREQAANALGKLRDARAVPPLVKALGDKDGAVRTAAVWALERIGDAGAVPGLVEALGDSTVREDVARVLKKDRRFPSRRCLDRRIDGQQLDGAPACRGSARKDRGYARGRGVDSFVARRGLAGAPERGRIAGAIGGETGDRPAAPAAGR